VTIDLESINWVCDVCQEERPDAMIGVHRADVSDALGQPPGTAHYHVRYCIDRMGCIKGAPKRVEQFLAHWRKNHDTGRV
jgi:hypothetical protein